MGWWFANTCKSYTVDRQRQREAYTEGHIHIEIIVQGLIHKCEKIDVQRKGDEHKLRCNRLCQNRRENALPRRAAQLEAVTSPPPPRGTRPRPCQHLLQARRARRPAVPRTAPRGLETSPPRSPPSRHSPRRETSCCPARCPRADLARILQRRGRQPAHRTGESVNSFAAPKVTASSPPRGAAPTSMCTSQMWRASMCRWRATRCATSYAASHPRWRSIRQLKSASFTWLQGPSTRPGLATPSRTRTPGPSIIISTTRQPHQPALPASAHTKHT